MSSAAADIGPAAKRRAPRWMWALLILSLCLNLLIAGIVLGSIWAVRKGGYWNAPVAFERSQRFMASLPQERRQEIRAVFFEQRKRLEPYWRDVREARVTLGRLIERGNYAQAVFEAAIDDLNRKEAAAREAAKPMLTAMVAKLQPNERVHFLSVFMPYLDEIQGRPAAKLPE
ncbi:MAG TPA: periplasmic heavy metal sensor [Hyphomicrobiales bacterium]|jgi:uncharacterized membrane protein